MAEKYWDEAVAELKMNGQYYTMSDHDLKAVLIGMTLGKMLADGAKNAVVDDEYSEYSDDCEVCDYE